MAATPCSSMPFNCSSFSSSSSSSSFPHANPKLFVPISLFPFNHRLNKPKFDSISFKPITPRLEISLKVKTPLENLFRLPVVSCLVEDGAGVFPESSDSSKAASIDIKLPRRSLLVTFTCNACGARSQKFVNRLAYERGTVFVQCAGCFRHHKLVDNLNLIVEYNFLEEDNMDPDDVNQL